MLFGEFYHQIDAKNRFRIPTKLSAHLGANPVISKGTNGCLFLFAREVFETKIADQLDASPIDTTNAKAVRVLFSSAAELEEDGQGRCLLPKNLLEFAKIQKDIVFIGVGNRAEIWAKEEYGKYML